MKKSLMIGATVGFALLVGSAPTARAQAIFSPTSGVVNSGGTEGAGSLTWTFDHSGLSTNFISGVTNFNTYIAGNPLHTDIYVPFEWFSGVSPTAVVTYDFGSVLGIDRFALWNEEFSGIGFLNILGSTNGTTFTSILNGLTPPNNPLGSSYPATVYSFDATSARFFRLEMSGCPQPNGGGYNGCSIGEVAFRSAEITTVTPEPGSMTLVASGLFAVGMFVRRRRKA
jgi:hypothetical protein